MSEFGEPLVKVEVEGVLIEENSDSIWRGSTLMNRSGERSDGFGLLQATGDLSLWT
jgi:hypothetical protein